tara:strand:- start:302 stop:874 length:573 start_codon:yes stop_codon:yes gene_type:complete
MKYDIPPFDLGETLSGTDSDSNLTNAHWCGAVFEFPDVDRTPALRGGKSRRSGQALRAVCVRNTKGSALTVATATYGLVLSFDVDSSAGRLAAGACAGASITEGDWSGVGDPELGAITVADDDLFWLIISGVVPIYAEGGIAVGAPVVADAGTDGHAMAATAAHIGNIMGVAVDAISDNNAGLVHLHVPY